MFHVKMLLFLAKKGAKEDNTDVGCTADFLAVHIASREEGTFKQNVSA